MKLSLQKKPHIPYKIKINWVIILQTASSSTYIQMKPGKYQEMHYWARKRHIFYQELPASDPAKIDVFINTYPWKQDLFCICSHHIPHTLLLYGKPVQKETPQSTVKIWKENNDKNLGQFYISKKQGESSASNAVAAEISNTRVCMVSERRWSPHPWSIKFPLMPFNCWIKWLKLS